MSTFFRNTGGMLFICGFGAVNKRFWPKLHYYFIRRLANSSCTLVANTACCEKNVIAQIKIMKG